MGDLILFLMAVLFIVLTSPLWGLLGAGWSFAIIAWTLIKFLGLMVLWIIMSVGAIVDLEFGRILRVLIRIVTQLFIDLWDGIVTFFVPFSHFWEFARYDHYWWALFISICILNLITGKK
jgi:hypothetical protein